jgi:hypothetical protein
MSWLAVDRIRERLLEVGAFALVEGIAGLSLADDAALASPAAFVFEAESVAGPNTRATGGLLQRVEADIAVVVVVRNDGDITGAAASDEITPLEAVVRSTLLGWLPEDPFEPLTLVSTKTVRARKGVVWREILFATAYYLEA